MKEIDINEIRRITNEAIRKRDANSRTISDKIIRRLNDKIHCAAHMCKNSITEFVSDAECTSDTIMGNIDTYSKLILKVICFYLISPQSLFYTI